jgi:hypothetical protein
MNVLSICTVYATVVGDLFIRPSLFSPPMESKLREIMRGKTKNQKWETHRDKQC